MLTEFSPAEAFVGRWVEVLPLSELGLGFCVAKRDGQAVVVYKDVPGVIEHEYVVPISDLTFPRVPTGSRVWVRGTVYGWHAGVVQDYAGAERYRVSISGAPQPYTLYQDQFHIRWNRPLIDPLTALVEGLCDSPEYYEARRDFSAELINQRRASRGYSAVLSASVKLFQHQLDTVARVLSDPVMRFLLADEVGLGKTIEAGLIARQLLLDDRKATVLVVVPKTLIGQWHDELRAKLGLSLDLASGRVQIVSHDQLEYEPKVDAFTLVIIDEAHRILKYLDRTPPLRRALKQVQGLIALSATPMRGELQTLHDLLSLVDPSSFPGSDRESFKQRVDQRERSAGDLDVLTSKRSSLRRKLLVLESLGDQFSTDENIHALATLCREAEDVSDPGWFDLANYVRETYRLSRRMIRHRRGDDLTSDYPTPGRIGTFVEVSEPLRSEIEDFLERVRERGPSPANFYRLVEQSLAGPAALESFLQDVLRSGSLKQETRTMFDSMRARLRGSESDARTIRALEVVEERVSRGLKVVVACTEEERAIRFARFAETRIGGRYAGAHLTQMDSDECDAVVIKFLASEGGALLVADQSMEEGANLQDAHVLVNMDLPLDPNSLDQRIGRLDRFTARVDPVEIVSFSESDSQWISGQLHLLVEGIGIFERPVSTVQRRLSEFNMNMQAGLVDSGAMWMQLDTESLRQSLEDEMADIELLEELESLSVAADFDDANFAELQVEDARHPSLRLAFNKLASSKGGIALRPSESADGRLTFPDSRRITGVAGNRLPGLISIAQGVRAFDRAVATSHHMVAPLRIGDPLVDWLDEFLKSDECGRSRAVVRASSRVQTPTLWLHSEFVIEFDPHHLTATDEGVLRRLRRRGDSLMTPERTQTWTDTAGAAPSDLVRDVLDRPFDPTIDEVLRGKIWDTVLDSLPDWKVLCRESGSRALELIASDDGLNTKKARSVLDAQQRTESRLAVLRARALRLPGRSERESAQAELAREAQIGRSLVAGIETPLVRVVACGAVVLWPEGDFYG